MRLKELRSELRVNQMEVAVRAKVSLSSVVTAEKNEKGQFLSTLLAILKALNEIRGEQGLPPVDPKEMDWKIR